MPRIVEQRSDFPRRQPGEPAGRGRPDPRASAARAAAGAPPSNQGVWITLALLALWGAHLCGMLWLGVARAPLWLWVPGMAFQSFLYTGLFIAAHDAMHGSICVRSPRINDFIGTLCAALYANFSFRRLRAEHWKHHAHPGSAADPDFHDGAHPGFLRWYLHFVVSYFSWLQILGMTVLFQLLYRALGLSPWSLILFWVVPSLLSTLQLFYFGTYLPHREPAEGYDDHHHARSNDFSDVLSFLTCYHFGYHWEHHEYPHVPWWRLPAVRKAGGERRAARVAPSPSGA